MNNRVKGIKGNSFQRDNVYLLGLRIRFVGQDNSLIIGGGKVSVLERCNIEIHGSHNRIIIEGGVSAKDLKIYCADEHCFVYVKEDSCVSGQTELAAMEGTKIIIGKDCLFSANITLRAGDSHSVIDAATSERINPSKDIIIGDHVWIGNTVIVTKGTVVGNNSVIATGSVVTGKMFPDNCIIGGNPARIIKEGIDWNTSKL